MKKRTLFLILCAFSLGLMACTDGESEIQISKIEENSTTSSLKKEYYGIYPNSIDYKPEILSRSGLSFDTDWEQFQVITLNSGNPVATPWATNSLISIDKSERLDVKKEDGWLLAHHTIQSNVPDASANYIILYNQITGEVKIFYYVESSSDYPTSKGVWRISFSGSNQNKWLNSIDQIATPSNYYGNSILNSSSLRNQADFGFFSTGWQCCIFPTTFWPNQPENLDMQIGAFGKSSASRCDRV